MAEVFDHSIAQNVTTPKQYGTDWLQVKNNAKIDIQKKVSVIDV